MILHFVFVGLSCLSIVVGHGWKNIVIEWFSKRGLSLSCESIFLWIRQLGLVLCNDINWSFQTFLKIVTLSDNLNIAFNRLLFIQKCGDWLLLYDVILWVGSIICIIFSLGHELIKVISIWVSINLSSWFDIMSFILPKVWDISIKLSLIPWLILIELILLIQLFWVHCHLFAGANLIREILKVVLVPVFVLLNFLKSLADVISINLIVELFEINLETSHKHLLLVIEVFLHTNSGLFGDIFFNFVLYTLW